MSENPVRIAFCITELDPGGAERALVRIVSGLDRTRWHPHVYCLTGRGPLAAELECADVCLTCLGARSVRDVGVILRLARELKAFQPALLQTFMFHGNLAGRIAAQRAKVPVVVSGVRVVEPDAQWRMRLDSWTRRLVERTICVSRGVADQYRSLGFREDELAVVPNGVDVERFAIAEPTDLSQFGIPHGAFTILSIGRLHPQKGQSDLLAAFARLQDIVTDNRERHLLLVGDGADREALVEKARVTTVVDRVHFAGQLPDVAPILKACDLFVLPSHWEGMPNALLEAMAAGLPCVATNVEGVPELITEGQTGLLAPPADPQSLADQINRLIHDPALAGRLGTAARKHVREHFTWAATIRGFETVWNDLLPTIRAVPTVR